MSDSIIAIINGFIAYIFSWLGEFMVKHTTIETQVVSFSYILILEFINMGFIILIMAFDPSGIVKKMMDDDTDYIWFDNNFYTEMGNSLCETILLSVIFTNIGEVKALCTDLLKRWKDRGFKLTIKKDLEDDDDDEPNSK